MKSAILVRSYPKNKHHHTNFIQNFKSKMQIIHHCFNQIANQLNNSSNIDVYILHNGYSEEELQQIKKYNFQYVESPVGDGPSCNFMFNFVKNNIENYDIFFTTEDDYYFEDNFIQDLIAHCNQYKDTMFSPFSPVNSFFEHETIKYIPHCFVNFAGHRDIFKKLMPHLLETTSGPHPIQEQYFYDNIWARNINEINLKVKLGVIKKYNNIHIHNI